jgi:hypothetical protein
VLLSIRDYVKLAAPEHEVLRLIGQKSERSGASTLTSRHIDQIIKTSRSRKAKRAEPALSLSKGVPAPRGR